MEEFVIKNRAGVTNRFIKIEADLYDDGHYVVHENSGNDWYLRTDANYIREMHDENGKILPWNDPRTAKARSKTFPGIARAMAEQWAGKA